MIALILIGLCLTSVLLLFLTVRLLARVDRYRRWAGKRGRRFPRSRFLEDLRPIQRMMLDFIVASPAAPRVLRRLSEDDRPIPLPKLMANVPANEISWNALLIMGAAGLIRLRRDGIALSEAGHEALARMRGGHNTRAQVGLRSVHSEIGGVGESLDCRA